MYAAGGGRAGFYDADLGANIPTTGDIDFYSSPILASNFDADSVFAVYTQCTVYPAHETNNITNSTFTPKL